MPDVARLADCDGRPGATVFDGEPRVVRLALDAGESVPPHEHPGTRIVLHVVEGRLAVAIDDETHVHAAGELLRFEGDRTVSPRAVEDAVAVLVLAPD